MPLYRLSAIVGLIVPAISFGGDVVAVAVANNFQQTATDIAHAFSLKTGVRVEFSAGSSGKLYAQVVNGAPFDVFLSADTERAEKLEQDGLAVKGSRFTYATGRLVLWSKDPQYKGRECGKDLKAGKFKRIAIANAMTAPYGVAAEQVLKALGLSDKALEGRVVRGENVTQTLQFVESGSAELGLVALAQVRHLDAATSGETCRWTVPQELHRPIEQQGVLLTRAAAKPGAAAFLEFLKGEVARQMILADGYSVGELVAKP
jgi:molybdate transport system substrate-binding protein